MRANSRCLPSQKDAPECMEMAASARPQSAYLMRRTGPRAQNPQMRRARAVGRIVEPEWSPRCDSRSGFSPHGCHRLSAFPLCEALERDWSRILLRPFDRKHKPGGRGLGRSCVFLPDQNPRSAEPPQDHFEPRFEVRWRIQHRPESPNRDIRRARRATNRIRPRLGRLSRH